MTKNNTQNKSYFHIFLIYGLVIFICLFSMSCKKKRKEPPPLIPVTVANVVIQPEPLYLSLVGIVEPIQTVSVKSKVEGDIIKVAFTEGQYVKKGQLLLQIDPKPFQAALGAAQAQLLKDKAQAANAEIEAKRYAELVKKDYVTKEQVESAQTQAETYKAMVKADEESVVQAKLNLDDTSITAPIAGRTGSLLVKLGNVIQVNTMTLLVINQIHPIRISFAIPAYQLPLVQKYAAQSKNNLEVRVKPARQKDSNEIKGLLTFIDNTIDQSSGTINLKAEFSNKEELLWPGQFTDTELLLTIEPNAITIPTSAVVTSQTGDMVFVIGPDNTAEKRLIKVNRTQHDLAIIDEGLHEGEKVVTDGQLRLLPGSKVEIKSSLSENQKSGSNGPVENKTKSNRIETAKSQPGTNSMEKHT